MSLRAMLWALNDAPTDNPTDSFVLVALADNAWDDGKGAFPAVETIAKRARVSERTVQRSLRTLEADGLIRRGDQGLAAALGRHAPTVYELALELIRGDADNTNPQVSRGDNLSPLRPVKLPEPVDNPVRGDTDDTLGVTQVSPEPRPLTKDPREQVFGGVSPTRARGETAPPEMPPNYDEHGPLTPRCRRHVASLNDDPCRDCGAVRAEFIAARTKRAAAAARGRQDVEHHQAAVGRRSWEVPPPEEVAPSPPAIAAAKAALRGHNRSRAENDERNRRQASVDQTPQRSVPDT